MNDAAEAAAPHAVVWARVALPDRAAFLAAMADLRARLDHPVQAVRADRVLSRLHVAMAVRHAVRARAEDRARATDPAVEFLLYLAAERQIGRAVAALGITPGATQDVAFVALGTDDVAALGAAVAPFAGDVADAAPPGTDAAAGAWWAHQVRAAAGAAPRVVEDRVLGRMALLALERA